MMQKTRVVASLLTNDQEYQALQATEAQNAAKRAALEIETVFAKNNGSLQREQLYRFIHAPAASRPAVIIVQTVAGDGLPKVAHDAAAADVGWILLNRNADYIDDLRRDHAQLPIGIVSIDHVAIGRIQGRQLRAQLPRGGNVLYIQGPAESSAAAMRLQGVQEAIGGTGITLKIIHGEWTEVSGEKATTSWLRLSTSRESPPDAVAAQNDAMAVGARKAIGATMPDWLARPFFGCDGLVEGGQRLVREHVLAATIIVLPTAGVAVELAARQLSGGLGVPAKTVLEPRPYPS